MSDSKQVIVMRKFPSLRTGKYVAQGAHAAVGALFSIGKIDEKKKEFIIPLDDPFIYSWVAGNFKKVACYVNTDAEIGELYQKARALGLPCSLIRDAGLTEFNGVPTITAVGIGPGDPDLINKVTGDLPLF